MRNVNLVSTCLSRRNVHRAWCCSWYRGAFCTRCSRSKKLSKLQVTWCRLILEISSNMIEPFFVLKPL